MILMPILSLWSSLFGMVAAPSSQDGEMVRRVIIQGEVIIRVPVRRRMSPPIEWIEQMGPKCVASRGIVGAFLSDRSSIDFLLADRRRVRAKLDSDCPSLDYYGNFYFQLDDDERICAKRDFIRSRIGGSCRIDRFRLLVPHIKR